MVFPLNLSVKAAVFGASPCAYPNERIPVWAERRAGLLRRKEFYYIVVRPESIYMLLRSLDVLNLLAHFLQLGFHVDDKRRKRSVVRFGAYRVDFPVHLLN